MKKFFSLIIAVIMLVAVFTMVASAEEGQSFHNYGEIKTVERRSIRLDGIKEDAYDKAVAIPIKYPSYTPQSGAFTVDYNQDVLDKGKRAASEPVAEGTAYVVYDTSYIWVFVEVTDATLETRAADALQSKYTEDSVEIIIDWTNEGKNINDETPYQSRVSHEGYISARLGQGGVTMQGTAEQGSTNPVNWLQGTAVHTDKGYDVEFKIDIPDDIYALSKDGYITIGFTLNDYDSTGSANSRFMLSSDPVNGSNSWYVERMGRIKFPYAPYTADTTVLYVVIAMVAAVAVGTVTLVSLRKKSK